MEKFSKSTKHYVFKNFLELYSCFFHQNNILLVSVLFVIKEDFPIQLRNMLKGSKKAFIATFLTWETRNKFLKISPMVMSIRISVASFNSLSQTIHSNRANQRNYRTTSAFLYCPQYQAPFNPNRNSFFVLRNYAPACLNSQQCFQRFNLETVGDSAMCSNCNLIPNRVSSGKINQSYCDVNLE